jgi:hypothetical protein
VPQPVTVIARDRQQLLAQTKFPVFVKAPVGTATTGVHLVRAPAELIQLADGLDDDVFADGGLVLQQSVPGHVVMVQGVFHSGRLIAWHANTRTREGVNGGASRKRSVPLPAAADYLVALGEGLGWHGALSFDLIVAPAPDPPVVIDINPRLVEPGNAWRPAPISWPPRSPSRAARTPTPRRPADLMSRPISCCSRCSPRRPRGVVPCAVTCWTRSADEAHTPAAPRSSHRCPMIPGQQYRLALPPSRRCSALALRASYPWAKRADRPRVPPQPPRPHR